MNRYQDRFVEAGGLRMHLLDWGDGSGHPLLLLHGTSSTAHSWDRIAPELLGKYRPIAIDSRGAGESDRSPEVETLDLLAADVGTVADALGLDRFAVYGLSMGGRRGMAYAASNPDRVTRLIVEDMAPTLDPEISARVQSTLGNVIDSYPSFEDYVAALQAQRPRLADEWIREQARWQSDVLPDRSVKLKWRPNRTAGMPPQTGRDLWSDIGNITCPVLLLRGKESDVLSPAYYQRMLTAIPNIRGIEIPDAGHNVHEDNPAAVLAAVREFLEI